MTLHRLRRLREATFASVVAFMLVLAALLGAGSAAAQDAPRGADGLLAVPPLARVTDLAGVLPAERKAALEQRLAQFESARGAQVAVVVVPSTQPEPIEDFANRVGNAWKIGRRGVGDGLLLVVATQDRRVRIDVARALEGALPDVAARRIIREAMAPRFQANDFAGGIDAALTQIFRAIESEGLPTPAGVPQRTVEGGEDTLGLLVPFIIGGLVVGSVLRRVVGAPGALLAGGGTGGVAGWLLASAKLGLFAGVAVLLLSLLMGNRGVGRSIGGRRGGIATGGWGGGWPGGGSWGGGGGGGGGGGWSSGGGGDFSGGGASGNW